MSRIINFPTPNYIKPEDQFITVLKDEHLHIKWNRSQLYYIQNLIDPSKSNIKSYAKAANTQAAQEIAKWIRKWTVIVPIKDIYANKKG